MSAAVGDLALSVGEVVLDDADRQPEEAVDAAHPLGVAPGQVVVDGDDVDALAGERVQVGRQRRDERLAFAGLHLGDAAAVQHHAADELDVEVPHVQHAPAGLADHRERFRAADRRASRRCARRVPELGGLAAQLLRRRAAVMDSFERVRPAPTSGRSRLSSRSFWVPMTLARIVWSIYRTDRAGGYLTIVAEGTVAYGEAPVNSNARGVEKKVEKAEGAKPGVMPGFHLRPAACLVSG